MPRPTDRMACARLAWKPGQVPEGGSLVVCSLAGPIPYEKKEPAGIKFHEAVLRQQGLFGERTDAPPFPASAQLVTAVKLASLHGSKQPNRYPFALQPRAAPGGPDTLLCMLAPAEDPEAEKPATGKAAAAAGSASAADADGDMQPPPDVNWKGKKKKAKAKRTADNDFYALLGLANERFLATEAQIKNGYRCPQLALLPLLAQLLALLPLLLLLPPPRAALLRGTLQDSHRLESPPAMPLGTDSPGGRHWLPRSLMAPSDACQAHARSAAAAAGPVLIMLILLPLHTAAANNAAACCLPSLQACLPGGPPGQGAGGRHRPSGEGAHRGALPAHTGRI